MKRLSLVILAVMAAGFLALGLAEARADAPTFDEPVYVSAGLAAVLHHDVMLNDEHPPLLKVLAVVPVLFAHPVIPADGRRSGHDERGYAARFAGAQLAAGKLAGVTFAARLVPTVRMAAATADPGGLQLNDAVIPGIGQDRDAGGDTGFPVIPSSLTSGAHGKGRGPSHPGPLRDVGHQRS